MGSTARAGYSDTSAVVADGSWHHAVLLRRSGTVELYADGMRVHSYPYSGTANATTELVLGKHGTKSLCFFDGKLDDLRIYSYALTAEEIMKFSK